MELEDAQRAVSDAYDAFGLDCGLGSFETVFFLTDHLRSIGFVSTHPTAQIGRIVSDISFSWYESLHALIVPNPQSLFMNRESQALSEAVRQRILEHMDLLARSYRRARHAHDTGDDELLSSAIRSIVSLRFGSLSTLFDDVQAELDEAWSEQRSDEHDQRTYG